MIRLSPPERLGEFFGLYGLVGKGSQVIGQLLYGVTIVVLLGPFGVGAYQVAVLSLLVTMFIGLWLILPVRDDWAGSGEVGPVAFTLAEAGLGPPTPPERLVPGSGPLEPR
jgi:MFS-type transporter involved in bile tolerance (Atg22 family)